VSRDVRAIRQVSLTEGARIWVEPTSAGLCVYATSYGVCNGTLDNTRQSGMSLNYKFSKRKRVAIGVVPDTNTTIRAKTATSRIVTYPVRDGVYVVPTGLRHIYIKSL
jgi:hypothetical protein